MLTAGGGCLGVTAEAVGLGAGPGRTAHVAGAGAPAPAGALLPPWNRGLESPRAGLGAPLLQRENSASASGPRVLTRDLGLLGVRPPLAQGPLSCRAPAHMVRRPQPHKGEAAACVPGPTALRSSGRREALRGRWAKTSCRGRHGGPGPTERPGQGGRAMGGRLPEPTGPGVRHDGALPRGRPSARRREARAPRAGPPPAAAAGPQQSTQGLCPPHTRPLCNRGALTSARRASGPCGRRPRPPRRAPGPAAAARAAARAAGSGRLQGMRGRRQRRRGRGPGATQPPPGPAQRGACRGPSRSRAPGRGSSALTLSMSRQRSYAQATGQRAWHRGAPSPQ